MRAKRTDRSQAEIVRQLRECGIKTTLTNMGDDFPDSMTDWHQWVLIELKEPAGKLSRGQMRFIAHSSGHVGVATDFLSAHAIAKWPKLYAINGPAKDRIAAWLLQNPEQESMRVKKFLKLVKGEKDAVRTMQDLSADINSRTAAKG